MKRAFLLVLLAFVSFLFVFPSLPAFASANQAATSTSTNALQRSFEYKPCSVTGLCYVVRRSGIRPIEKRYTLGLVVVSSVSALSMLALVLYSIKTPPCLLPPYPECW